MPAGGARQQQVRSRAARATDTIGTPSASKQQDEARPGAWLITVHVIEAVDVAERAAPQYPALQVQAVAVLCSGESALVPHDMQTEPAKLYFPVPQFSQSAAPSEPAGEDVPGPHFVQPDSNVAGVDGSYVPAGHAWRGQRVTVQQRGQSTAAGVKATGTSGTHSPSTQLDEKRAGAWLITVHVIEVPAAVRAGPQ
jgi:hypothetical protein